MKYRHIPTGVIVTSDKELPIEMYERVDEPKPKQATRKRTTKTTKE